MSRFHLLEVGFKHFEVVDSFHALMESLVLSLLWSVLGRGQCNLIEVSLLLFG